ncbi:hypothetical protein BpHYR1_047682 [Brachionus plicatilis]|uniref:Uncharacterized protein n=1 Tax=Brachionus plicatilis TaxID=10195 RepID=A0A3M7T2W7_BRAPC|nr:hypothetical protein BpHYR1_047682 [Brachionus plicatilis]
MLSRVLPPRASPFGSLVQIKIDHEIFPIDETKFNPSPIFILNQSGPLTKPIIEHHLESMFLFSLIRHIDF